MTNSLSNVAVQKFFDNNGKPAAGYKLFTYEAGTSVKLATYQDNGTGSPNTNPIILDFRGECRLWTPPNVAYKYVFAAPNDTDPPGAPIWTVDNIVDSQLVTLYGGVDTGIANAYVLNFVANFSSYTDGIVIYWIPSNTNTGPSTLNVNGLGPIPILTQTGGALVAGTILANQMVGVICRSGSFYLTTVTMLSGSFTANLTGFTGVVQGTVNYRAVGGVVTLTAPNNINGTSNTTIIQITNLPLILAPGSNQTVMCTNLRDNGVGAFCGACNILTGSPLITIARLAVSGSNILQSGAFTAAGTKGLDGGWTMMYQQ